MVLVGIRPYELALTPALRSTNQFFRFFVDVLRTVHNYRNSLPFISIRSQIMTPARLGGLDEGVELAERTSAR